MRINDSIFLGAALPDMVDGSLVIQQNKRLLFLSLLSRIIDVVVSGVPPLSLPDAIADSLSYVKAFGGAEQRNLPKGYTELEYIESTRTQYIDTGVGLNAANKITGKISFVTLNNLAYIAGGRLSGGVAIGYALYAASHSGFTIYNASWPEQGIDVSANQILEFETVMKSGQQSFIVNGNTIVTGDRTIYLDSSNIYLFGLKTEYMAAAKVYSLKIYDNDTLVRNFVPAKNSSGVVGMYDTVNDVFYTDTGFVAGSEVGPTPDNPIDIVSNNGVLRANTNLYWTEYKDSQLSQTDGITVTANSGVNVSGMVDCRTIKSFKITTVSPQGSFRVFKYRADRTFINTAATENIGDIVTFEDNVGFFRIQYNYKNAGVGTESILIYNSAYDLNGIYTDGTVETIEDTIGNTATAEMLLKVGDYKDVQEILAGDVTRKVGVKVLDGTEEIYDSSAGGYWGIASTYFPNIKMQTSGALLATHWREGTYTLSTGAYCSISGLSYFAFNKGSLPNASTTTDVQQWLADQCAAGTPVIIVYPLATETTESVAGQTLQVQAGDNTLEITQASLNGLELSVTYKKNN